MTRPLPFLFTNILISCLCLFFFQPRATLAATILIYHKFGESHSPSTNVSIDNFRRQMEYLSREGYKVVALSEIVASLREKKSIPDRTVAITVDDGYRSIYINAWPILKSFRYPFTVFLSSKAVEGKYSDFLTWDQIRELSQAGVHFENHGYSHARYGERPAGMNEEAYRRWVGDDIKRNADVMEERIGQRPRYLALPYGEYNRLILDMANQSGSEAIFTQDPGAVSEETDLAMIPREPILGNDWSRLEHFIKILRQDDLPLTHLQPDIIPITDPLPHRFSARISHPERYKEGSFSLYVSELGWQKAKVEADTVYIENIRPLKRRTNRVMVSAREKDSDQVAVRYWLLLRE